MPGNLEKGSIIVTSSTPGLKIYLQNTYTGKVTPDTLIDLMAGDNYNVSIKPREYASVSNVVSVKNKLATTVNFSIENTFGTVYITTTPESLEIYINGVNTGKVTPDTVDYIMANTGSYNPDYITLKKGTLIYSTNISAAPGLVTNKVYDLTSKLNVHSNPSGANIYLNNVNTGKRTPYQFTKLVAGNYEVRFKLTGYLDTTMNVSLTPGYDQEMEVYLQDSIKYKSFGHVKLYAVSTSSSQKQAVDLSTGIAYVFNSSSYSYVDVYYTDDGLFIKSTDNAGYRYTRFTEGYGNVLFDGEDSPLYSSGYWSNSMPYDIFSCFYAYDYDNHYSKIMVTNKGGTGTTADPKWIEVQWLYNIKQSDHRF